MNMDLKAALSAYRERVADMTESIDRGIKENRSSSLRIHLRDAEGKPIRDARLRLVQKTSDFDFGCNALQLGQLGERNTAYEQAFTHLFNTATTTACWAVTETREGMFRFAEADGDMNRRPPMDRVVAFCKKNGLKAKCQPLMADSWFPEWASHHAEEAKAQWRRFVSVVAERYSGTVDIWDVVNESLLCKGRSPDFPLLDDDLSYVDWSFETAAQLFPPRHGVFELNDGTQVNCGEDAQTYYRLAKRLKDKQLPLDSVGFQFHIFTGELAARHLQNQHLPQDELLKTYAMFGQLGVPLSITEITIPSRIPGLEGDEGEAVQAEIGRNLYRLWFAQPDIHSIIYWNFMDGVHWGNEGDCRGCLLDEQLREKPIYQALYQLIQRQWRTTELLRSGEDGGCECRAFHGGYELTVDSRTAHRSVALAVHAGEKNDVTIVL